ncbi:MAG TPA: cell wall-binding protein [Microbacteriaceae bacterium]|jgi:murein DD-endopeptidase MepM/ murein hydrolase activator NlpD|nr:cell wall-binding protein [Microbacteriaceae bacterium]
MGIMSYSHHVSASPRVASTNRNRLVAILVAFALLSTGAVAQGEAAWAVTYPSWGDVQAARASEAAKSAEVARLKSLLDSLNAQVQATQAEAEKKGNELQVAQQKLDEAAAKADVLAAQADAAKARAKKSRDRAGAMASQMARSGSTEVVATLMFNGGKAADLLSQLSLASKVTDQSKGLYEKAIQEQNSAQSLTDQSNLAKVALKSLAEAAQVALDAAQVAATNAANALAEQTAHKSELDAQLASLVSTTAQTEAGYRAGVAAAAAAKAAAEAAARAAAAAAAAAGGGSGAGQVGSSGWARPAAGRITSVYGWRLDPYTHQNALHSGTDLGASCGSPIYAAHSGTVIYAGPYGGYGNFVQIANNDGTGISTGYGHIVNGGILVSVGQRVGVGTNIARVGSTGWSTGCHLHFEVRYNNVAQDPVPYLRDRGVNL